MDNGRSGWQQGESDERQRDDCQRSMLANMMKQHLDCSSIVISYENALLLVVRKAHRDVF